MLPPCYPHVIPPMSNSVRAVLVTSRKNVDGKSPIKICITINRKRTYMTTGFRIDLSEWDIKNNLVKKSVSNADIINATIKSKIYEYQSSILKHSIAGEKVSVSTFKNKRSKDVTEYIDQVLIDFKGKWSDGRVRHFKTERTRLHAFAPGIRFDEIDNSFLKRYEKFLRVNGNGNNTIHSIWKRLMRIFNLARKDGLTENYPFTHYENPKYKQTIRTFLLSDEVERIENLLKLPITETQNLVINYFLLGCYSGLRFSDWYRFNYDGFIQGDRIILGTKKTGEIISLQMHRRLKEVVERIRHLPKIISADKTRDYLVGIGNMAKIKKHITTHVARHSFAVRCAEMDIPPVVTAELMGISLREVMVYYQLTNRKIDAEFAKWDKI